MLNIGKEEILIMKIIDFRSDTVTVPTEEMRKAAYQAEVGDDVYGEDKTVNTLEEYAAAKVGKEAALFVTSGTMGNQIALLSHCQRGQEVILDKDSHIFNAEVGGTSFISGLQTCPIKGVRGIMDIRDIMNSVRPADIHHPQTGLICIENTHNMAGGVVWPLETLRSLYSWAQGKGIPVHMDGARVFNAATYLKCDARMIAQYCDSIMFCLSKGLCAPVGSILAGTKEFIEKARRYRKMLGGGMRQAGIIAAPGLVALKTMVERLEEDHINARKLADGFRNIKGLNITGDIHTNIVMLDTSGTCYNANETVEIFKKRGILAGAIDNYIIRFVTHKYISSEDVDTALKAAKQVFENKLG